MTRTVNVLGDVPVVNLNGTSPVYVEYGSGYTELGATRSALNVS